MLDRRRAEERRTAAAKMKYADSSLSLSELRNRELAKS